MAIFLIVFFELLLILRVWRELNPYFFLVLNPILQAGERYHPNNYEALSVFTLFFQSAQIRPKTRLCLEVRTTNAMPQNHRVYCSFPVKNPKAAKSQHLLWKSHEKPTNQRHWTMFHFFCQFQMCNMYEGAT